LLEFIRDRLGVPVCYVRYMGWFKMAMMHTKTNQDEVGNVLEQTTGRWSFPGQTYV
jgi:hypothetical protein